MLLPISAHGSGAWIASARGQGEQLTALGVQDAAIPE